MINWIPITKQRPFAYQTGHWDGKKSDLVLVYTEHSKIYAAEMYEGVLDGSEFCEFYDKNGEWEIDGVTHWAEINLP